MLFSQVYFSYKDCASIVFALFSSLSHSAYECLVPLFRPLLTPAGGGLSDKFVEQAPRSRAERVNNGSLYATFCLALSLHVIIIITRLIITANVPLKANDTWVKSFGQ